MKFTQKNAIIGIKSFLRQSHRISFLKSLASNLLQESYDYDKRTRSRIKSIRMDDPQIVWGGDITLHFESKAGNTTIMEQYALVSLAKRFQFSTFFEIGTFEGQTDRTLAKNLPDLHIYTLDLSVEQIEQTLYPISQGESRYIRKPIVGSQFLDTPEAAQITQLLGDSATFDFTKYANQMDAVFIDGCHDSSYVINDTKKALTLIKNTGIIIWHDYLTYDSVTCYLEELGMMLPLLHIQGTSMVIYLTHD